MKLLRSKDQLSEADLACTCAEKFVKKKPRVSESEWGDYIFTVLQRHITCCSFGERSQGDREQEWLGKELEFRL